MKKMIFAAICAVTIFAVSTTLSAAPNETSIDKDKYEVPPNG